MKTLMELITMFNAITILAFWILFHAKIISIKWNGIGKGKDNEEQ